MIQAFQKVFSSWQYVFLSMMVAILILFFAVWIPNFSFLGYVLTSGTYDIVSVFSILFSSFKNLGSNFTTLSEVSTVLVAVLSGINVSMVVYYFKQRVSFQREAGVGILGIVTGFFGVGCAACGSVVISAVFGVTGSAAVIKVLPFHGAEFSLLSVFLLFLATYLVAKKISQPQVCAIEH